MTTLLAERLGLERAEIVIAKAGGKSIRIPNDLSHYRTTDALERRFGKEIAVALVLHFGGQLLYIPNGRDHRAEITDTATVVKMTKRNKSANEIAGVLGCSDRTVYHHRAKARAAGLLPA